MTKIDRYILVLFLRTAFICFCSIAGIFIVFHAFGNMDKLSEQSHAEGSLLRAVMRMYGPYMLMLFDWTGTLIALMAFMFTMSWLRRTGELTSTLAVGISHGRLIRPMIFASLFIVSVQLVNRELILPQYRDRVSLSSKVTAQRNDLSVKACYDKINRVLIDGSLLDIDAKRIEKPRFQIDGDYSDFGDLLVADSAQWVDASERLPSGYLIDGVTEPDHVETFASIFTQGRPVLLTSYDQSWLRPGQAYFVTSVSIDFLRTGQPTTGRATIPELISKIRNSAVYTSRGTQVLLHQRIVRMPLDFALVLMVVPLVINRKNYGLFGLVGGTMLTVLGFFLIRMAAGSLGSTGYLESPALAAWIPLLLIGPLAYVRYRGAQLT